MIRKRLSLLSALMLLCTVFAGCGTNAAAETDKDSLSIVTTCFPPYDFARAVKGDDDGITMLLCPGAEAHSYEPAPLDILKIRECDVFIYIGGEGEIWADEILESIDTSDKYILKLSDYAELLEEADIPGASSTGHHHHHHDEDEECEDEHSHEDEHECEFDEHIWTSLKNSAQMTEAICDALCSVDAENAELYRKNTQNYVSEMNRLDSEFSEMIENAQLNTIVMGDRFPFRYLAYDYSLEYYSAFTGCSSETEPGVYTMAFLMDRIIEKDIDRVFYLEFSTKRIAEKLSDATGAEMLPLQSCHNVSADDFQNGVTYTDLMRLNFNSIREALY